MATTRVQLNFFVAAASRPARKTYNRQLCKSMQNELCCAFPLLAITAPGLAPITTAAFAVVTGVLLPQHCHCSSCPGPSGTPATARNLHPTAVVRSRACRRCPTRPPPPQSLFHSHAAPAGRRPIRRVDDCGYKRRSPMIFAARRWTEHAPTPRLDDIRPGRVLMRSCVLCYYYPPRMTRR